ncbi:hypothetical protein C8R48DRAFT_771141 [Suillus tomentosus]|nr:hypothetical protein C8R48DRAFT_771141 [Suillus tomentosus]
MSACLVADMNTPHNFQDDMESTLYVILWIMFIFTGSGGSGKANFLQLKSSITSTTPLFKGRPALDALVQQLQKTFSARYIPSMKEAEENVRLAKLHLHDPIVKMALQDNLVAIKLDGLEAMKSHEGVINIFNTHLDREEGWLDADSPDPQRILVEDHKEFYMSKTNWWLWSDLCLCQQEEAEQ